MPTRTIILVRLLVLLVLAGVLSAVVLVQRPGETPAPPGGIRVVATFYPLAEFARAVGGEHVAVTLLAKAGVEAHDYEPTPQDLAAVQSANLFVLQGGGFDVWAERMAPEPERTVNVVETLIAEGTLSVPQGPIDPHVWLDPRLAAAEVRVITAALQRADQGHAQDYAARSEQFIAELLAIDTAYRAGLASCARRVFVAPHAAFRFLADAYNLEMLSLVGLSPLDEPSPKRLGEVIERARAAGVTTIFYEPLEGPKLAETVAQELGAQIRPLSPLEGLTLDDEKKGKTYSDLMRENLVVLQEALECQRRPA